MVEMGVCVCGETLPDKGLLCGSSIGLCDITHLPCSICDQGGITLAGNHLKVTLEGPIGGFLRLVLAYYHLHIIVLTEVSQSMILSTGHVS